MKSHYATVPSLVLTAAGVLLFSGCPAGSSSDTGQPAASAAQFLLSEEPQDPQGVTACREKLEELGEPRKVVLIARVGGLNQPTWDPERAVFMVSDLSLEEQDHEAAPAPGHDADNCPFCRQRKQKELAGMAMVELVDGNGTTPQTSAQQLLGLAEGQTVVIRGTAELDNLGTLLVRTSGIYIKQDAAP